MAAGAAGTAGASEVGTRRLSIGVARREVTPPAGIAMAGFAARRSPCTGMHDPLFASAVVARCERTGPRVAIVAVDVIALDIAEIARVRHGASRVTGIPYSHVVVAATHTHGGPSVMPGRMGGNVDRTYLDRLVAATVEAVGAADRSRATGQVHLSVGSEGTVARNRRIAEGPVDPEVPALWIHHGERLAGAIASYACHPTVLSHENLLVTRDYPGAVVAALERDDPALFAMFLTGCAGDTNPGYDPAPGAPIAAGRTFDDAARVGNWLAEAARAGAQVRSAPDPGRTTQVQVASRPVELPLLPRDDYLVEQAAALR